MQDLWPTVLINGAVVLALVAALWRMNAQRLTDAELSIERRVEKGICDLKHQGLHDDLIEIKKGQEKMALTLGAIKLQLARRNGRRRAAEEK
jgi:hypothetical protein